MQRLNSLNKDVDILNKIKYKCYDNTEKRNRNNLISWLFINLISHKNTPEHVWIKMRLNCDVLKQKTTNAKLAISSVNMNTQYRYLSVLRTRFQVRWHRLMTSSKCRITESKSLLWLNWYCFYLIPFKPLNISAVSAVTFFKKRSPK